MKITAEINEIENIKTIEKFNETKSWLSKIVNKIDNSLARWTKKITNTQIIKIKNTCGDINSDLFYSDENDCKKVL